MQVWAVIYHPADFTEELYQQGLLLVDADSSDRIKRFYRREDACRTLIGKLLSRMLLREQGVAIDAMKFGVTETGKPYIAIPELHPPIGYNITHDNGVVAMVFSQGIQNGPAFNIGIDVMKVRIPGRETYASFIQAFEDQLTEIERAQLFPNIPQAESLQRFFWMWTMKEAYTKALGLGLGFEFSRVEFDVARKVVRVDGEIPKGWQFTMFLLNDEEDIYEGVVAEFLGGDCATVIEESVAGNWFVKRDAVEFVKEAINRLK